MTAGYYNTEVHDGYAGILEMCAQHGMVVTLTCVEMCDAQHPPEALCGPEGLLRQVTVDTIAILGFARVGSGSCGPEGLLRQANVETIGISRCANVRQWQLRIPGLAPAVSGIHSFIHG